MDGNETRRLGRRALLAAGAAGVAAAAAQAVAVPTGVRANNGDPLTIGATNAGSAETILQVSSSNGLSAWSTGGDGLAGGTGAADKSGIYGYCTNANGYGVYGRNTASGTEGSMGSGTHGIHGNCAAMDTIGVMGESSNLHGVGVVGVNSVAGTQGMFGHHSAGVVALAPVVADRVALEVLGRARFTRSGTLSIAARTSSISTAMPALTATSMVLATLQTNRAGVYIQAAVANPATNKITIYLNKKVTAATKVAYFVLN